MCENDEAVNAWFVAVLKRSRDKVGRFGEPAVYRSGYLSGVLRELVATVPGVREWLLEHMPERMD